MSDDTPLPGKFTRADVERVVRDAVADSRAAWRPQPQPSGCGGWAALALIAAAWALWLAGRLARG